MWAKFRHQLESFSLECTLKKKKKIHLNWIAINRDRKGEDNTVLCLCHYSAEVKGLDLAFITYVKLYHSYIKLELRGAVISQTLTKNNFQVFRTNETD